MFKKTFQILFFIDLHCYRTNKDFNRKQLIVTNINLGRPTLVVFYPVYGATYLSGNKTMKRSGHSEL